MSKKLLAALAAVCLCLIAASCGGGSEDIPPNMQLASDPNAPYIFAVPKTWVLNTGGGPATAYFSLNDRTNVSVSAYSPTEADVTLAGWLDDYFAEFVTVFTDLEVLPQAEGVKYFETELGEKAALRVVYTATMLDVEYKFMQLVAQYDGLIYLFTYTSTPDNFDLHQAELKVIVDAFKFR